MIKIADGGAFVNTFPIKFIGIFVGYGTGPREKANGRESGRINRFTLLQNHISKS